MQYFYRVCILIHIFLLNVIVTVFADDPQQVVDDFSQKSILMLKGPIAKLLGAVILLTGVASLLRGRHKLAMSCAVAFVMLLFLPILLDKVAIGGR